MIQQVLNRDFVLSCMAQVTDYIEQANKAGERRGEESDLSQLSVTDRAEVLEALREAQQSEAAESSGQRTYDAGRQAGSQRRGQSIRAMDEVSFISRSPVVSNIQSAIEERFDNDQSGRVVEESTRRGEASDLPTTNRRLFGPFEPADIRWISALAAMGIRLFRHKISFPERPLRETPLRLSNRARLILVGDWGTGIPRAKSIASEIGKVLQAGIQDGLEQHVIHLGDVYYSGWKREYQKHFLDCWPVVNSFEQIGSWTLNGNHDMYSGGYDYFGTALADPRFKRWQQGKSYFALENDNWCMLGLDSAYEDFDLFKGQHDWIKRQISVLGKQKLLLLTHHQPFSAYEIGDHPLEGTVSRLLGGREIAAWFWGHEHRCVFYRENERTKFGRCIGHGGVPVYQLHGTDDQVPEPGFYEFREHFGTGIQPWARFGFAVLDFTADTIETRYIDETGATYKTETIA